MKIKKKLITACQNLATVEKPKAWPREFHRGIRDLALALEHQFPGVTQTGFSAESNEFYAVINTSVVIGMKALSYVNLSPTLSAKTPEELVEKLDVYFSNLEDETNWIAAQSKIDPVTYST